MIDAALRLRTRWLAALSLGLATGCTILAPIQTQQADRRFPLKNEGTGNAPCKSAGETQLECQPLQDDIDAFYGGLGRALWETDVRRRALIGQAAAHTNINSAYNAMLWPLGAYFIQKKIRHPEWSAMDVAALAVASYGFLNSGIPDRDQLYVKTAARMACAMTLFDADLYLKSEVQPDDRQLRAPWTDWPLLNPAEDSLGQRINQLTWNLRVFTEQRDRVLIGTQLAARKSGPTGRTDTDRRRMEAMGLNSAPKAQKNPSADFLLETDGLITRAEEQLAAAQKLRQQLHDAGDRLRWQRIAIERALVQGLNERTPALQSPTSVATQIAQAFESGIDSERKLVNRIKKESGAARREDWAPTPANLADLTQDSRDAMTAFWTGPRPRLKAATANLASWMGGHDERVRLAKAVASGMGCGDGDLAEFTNSLKKATDAAATSASPSSGSGNSK
ncbi:hypothetical protein [Mitsuaria sp. GD03876]|uniref:hypothetical protein n=1 Tax=Mitsuaria sp. GD03876 TaxID=2975399 RepID=UPI002449B221|nr:hypothetical protein [Mitsuaria sp. GD03876]MDH0863334.1 hypothetical protein [Mitsuaria sp. GD03876]